MNRDSDRDLNLRPTRPAWLERALSDLDATLCDHFHCERKAASSALALVRYYSHHRRLVTSLAKLAHEETRHMMQVSSQLWRRNLSVPPDSGDTYASRLRREVRHGEPERQLDLLLVSGLIEARSAERLLLLGKAIEDRALAEMYLRLASAEERHRDLFLDLAREVVPAATFEKRLATLVEIEGRIVDTIPIEARIH